MNASEPKANGRFSTVAGLLQFALIFLCMAISIFILAYGVIFLGFRPLLLTLIVVAAAFGVLVFSLGALSGYFALKKRHFFIALAGPIATIGWVSLFLYVLSVWCSPHIKFYGIIVSAFMVIMACVSLVLLILSHKKFEDRTEAQAA